MTKQTLPKTVEYRGCTASIYLTKNRNTARYEVRYFDVEGSRQRCTFSTFEDAEEFANAAVREIIASRANFITLRGSEAHDYQQILQSLQPTGMSLREAVGLAIESRRLLNGSAGVVDAIRYYLDHRPRKSPDITVRQVVDELLALKQREGSVGPLHMRDLRNRLTRFGNLALVARSLNSEYGNLPYNEKRQRFLNNNKSRLDSLKMDLIYENEPWNDTKAFAHQSEMITCLDQYCQQTTKA